ncbi:hypothetical protein, partial [Acinetobacter baumannii]
ATFGCWLFFFIGFGVSVYLLFAVICGARGGGICSSGFFVVVVLSGMSVLLIDFVVNFDGEYVFGELSDGFIVSSGSGCSGYA